MKDDNEKLRDNEVWHDVIDLQVWKMTSITDECFENDGDNRYMNSADIEGLITEVEKLRGRLKKILEIAEHNMADPDDPDNWVDTDESVKWGAVVDIIKGWNDIER